MSDDKIKNRALNLYGEISTKKQLIEKSNRIETQLLEKKRIYLEKLQKINKSKTTNKFNQDILEEEV